MALVRWVPVLVAALAATLPNPGDIAGASDLGPSGRTANEAALPRTSLDGAPGALREAVRRTLARERHPVTVDPLAAAQEEDHLLASDGSPADFFGVSVALDSDTAVVGAREADTAAGADAGAAYVFVRTGGAWVEQAKLTASDGAAGDWFGWPVDVSGDTVVVGAVFDDGAAGADVGSAYVFVRSEATWTEQQKLTASDGAAGDWFGRSVGIDGDTIVAGAVFDDQSPGDGAGSAYVFVRSGSTWSQQSKLTASDAGAADQFGWSADVHGHTAVVGSYGDDQAAVNAGAAYVYVRSGTTWTEQHKLMASDATGGETFGSSVALDGDTAVVGAPLESTSAGALAGAVYAFVRSGTTWTEQEKLIATDGAAFDQFGVSIAVHGDTAAIGAVFDDTTAGQDAGSAYVFVRSGMAWGEREKLSAFDAVGGESFGSSVASDGATTLVGAPFDDTPAGVDAGSAYAFVSTPPPAAYQEAHLSPSDGAQGDEFGSSVAVDGDAAVVGAPWAEVEGYADAGAAYVFVRTAGTWTEQAKLVHPIPDFNDFFGSSVAISGDIVLVGAPSDTTVGAESAGSAFVFVRSGSTWSEEQQLIPSQEEFFGRFGESVAISGDTAVVGATNHDAAGTQVSGAAYVFVRSVAGFWSEEQQLTPSDAAGHEQFGSSVALDGDIAVVGAPKSSLSQEDPGSAYVFERSGTTWTEQQEVTAPVATGDDEFGSAVAVSRDTVVVGAPRPEFPAQEEPGAAYVFARSGTAWSLQQQLVPSGSEAWDRFGASVGVSGDTALVGAPFANAGAAYPFVRSREGVWAELPLPPVDLMGGSDFGAAVAVDEGTLAVGAPGDRAFTTGSVYIFVLTSAPVTPEEDRLTASDGAAGDALGASVALDGDTAVAGVPFDDLSAGVDAGSAYAFERSESFWFEQDKLVAPDGAAADEFGFSVAVDGDTAVVGARRDDTPAGADAGSAYVFVRSGTAWLPQAKLTAPDGAAGDEFGFSVALDGDTAVVGARRDDSAAGADAGSAYVFVRSGTAWTPQGKLIPSTPRAGAQFGFSVGVSGPLAVIGSPLELSGRAYVFARSGSTWRQRQRLAASDGSAGDRFGWSVAVDGQTAVVAAPQDDLAALVDAGSAYVFVRSGSSLVEQQKLTASDAAANDFFAWSVSLSGDTAVAGAPRDPFGDERGFAYAFERSGTNWSEVQRMAASDGVQGDGFAERVAVSGDRALVGAHLSNEVALDAGAVYVFAL